MLPETKRKLRIYDMIVSAITHELRAYKGADAFSNDMSADNNSYDRSRSYALTIPMLRIGLYAAAEAIDKMMAAQPDATLNPGSGDTSAPAAQPAAAPAPFFDASAAVRAAIADSSYKNAWYTEKSESGEVVLILKTDASLFPDVVAPALSRMKQHLGIGAMVFGNAHCKVTISDHTNRQPKPEGLTPEVEAARSVVDLRAEAMNLLFEYDDGTARHRVSALSTAITKLAKAAIEEREQVLMAEAMPADKPMSPEGRAALAAVIQQVKTNPEGIYGDHQPSDIRIRADNLTAAQLAAAQVAFAKGRAGVNEIIGDAHVFHHDEGRSTEMPSIRFVSLRDDEMMKGMIEALARIEAQTKPVVPRTPSSAETGVPGPRNVYEDNYCLGLMCGEMGEAASVIGNAMRFGLWTPSSPTGTRAETRERLSDELGDVRAAIDFAIEHKVADHKRVEAQRVSKLMKLRSASSVDNLGRRLAPAPREF